MVNARFARWLEATQTRRITFGRGLAAMMALGLGSAVGATDVQQTDAKKKRRCKKNRRRNPLPPCTELCDEGCTFCVTRTEDSALCGDSTLDFACAEPCLSDNDCVGSDRPYCISRVEQRETGTAIDKRCNGAGRCATVTACVG